MCFMVNMAMLFMFLMGSGLSYELPGPGILRSLNKNVTGSSQHPEIDKFAMSFAVDGSTSRNSGSCRCCAATQTENNPWIQIDLGRLYRVATVEVIGRTDFNDSFNMAINVSATNTISQGSTHTQETLSDEKYHNVTFSYPVIGQFVTLQLNGNVLLCVCEVNIYSKDCSNGTYGLYCNETCGQCQDGETCDFVTGRCTRCLPGYQLPLCTEECMPGTFGLDCSSTCHCKDNMTCDHVNGSCPGNKCGVGWRGSNCSLDCEPGTFGQNCSSLCHCYESQDCNHLTGRCPGDRCEVRWEGANCSLSTLRSRNAKVSGSSQYIATNSDTERFNLSHAVDGSTSMDPIACSCCASTASGNQPWIQIDLGRLYRVSIIDVIGRLNASKPFVGMHIYIHTQQNNWTKTNNLQLTIPNLTKQVFISVLKYLVIGRYVTLQLPDDNVILLVCEVSIYSNACSAGRFGANCSFLCHCPDNQTCDPATGGCPEGKCASGWEGITCSNTLISLNAGVNSSSIHRDSKFALSRAVDGSNSTNSTACKCCAATSVENQPWIQINLGRLYRVAKVEVIGRIDYSAPFAGMRIYLHETMTNWTLNRDFVLIIPNEGSRKYNTTLDNPVIAQYVTLQIPENDTFLVVCEVSVFSSYCSSGNYGLYCNETCGQCQNGETCDQLTGNCTQCLPGYQYPLCKNQCLHGSFGPNCSSACHCQGNLTCDHVNGSCPDGNCDLGWRGSNCSQDCSTGTYGLNCNETCGQCQKDETCHQVTGNCTYCLPGFQYPLCKKECVHGSYGSNCSSTCHCQGNGTCDHVNGSCPNGLCDLGWRGLNCSQGCGTGTYGRNCNETCGQCQNDETCDHVTGMCAHCLPGYQYPLCKNECVNGSFGSNCSSTCHCQSNGTCDHVNGSCPNGLCDLGWRGSNCSQKCPTGTYGINCNQTCGRCQVNQTCNHVTGNCAQCAPGYKFPLCKENCSLGFYGPFCNKSCGQCQEEETCDHVTGSCKRCRLGYQPPSCSDKCPPGRFGLDCTAGCNCNNNKTCNYVTGECPDNICDVGWMGVNCSTECDNMTYGNNCAKECGHCYEESCDRRTGECSPCFDGYTGKNCVEVCPPGTFGSNCSSICHCYDNMACDHVAGSCYDGRCDLGWQGYNCSQACSPGTYGENCSHTCSHCRNGVPCDRILGTCHLCQPGYTGTTCHNATVIITNVTVSGSSENPDARYDLFYVVDGRNRTDSAVCNCCAATQRENDPWIQIDLGRLYMVATVEILGRTDFNDSLSGMNIYIHTNNTEWNQTLTFTETISNVTDQHYVTTSQHPVIGQYVTLEKPGNNVSLYVCEVTVYIQDCSPGTYGRYCNEACGQCLDGETCDHVTGICTRCSPGYQLPLCNQTCPDRMFGENCTQHCGECAHITTCNSSTGHCDGDCETGFTGQLCKEKLKSTSPADNVQNPAGAIVGSVLAVICALIIVLIVIIRLSSKGVVKNKYLSAVVGRLSEISPSMIWRKMSDSDPGTPVEDADVISLHERAIEIPDDTDRRDLNNYEAPHIPVSMIWDYVRQEHSTDDGTILSEFKLLKKCPFYVSTFACLEENIPKNRYKGYQAYDHTRVRLVRSVGGDTDYINANYIQGLERRNKFIASQGPTVVMVEDFWLMVVQQNCSIIVMLTNVFEMGVKKCLQYWPSVGQMKFGSISVTLLDEEEFPDYIIRRLEIKLTDDGPGHVVNQYHFVSWPDKDVPDNVWCLVNFWRAVDSKAASLTTPVLVHCSAGVGRTGTFIGLDYLFYQAEATGSVCHFEVAKKLRQQRMKMIQTPAQYVYLHEALAEAILFGTTSITQDQFEEQYEYMTTTGKDGTSGFGKQFKLISDSFEQVETVIEETEYSNVDWNVNGDGKVSTDACTTVTGVINLPMVTGPNSCLLVRSPGSDDVEMIWKIISKFSVSTVVMATSTTHPNYEVSLNLDVSDRWSNGSLHIQVVSCDEKPKRTSFCLNGTTKVTQFQIPGCEGDSPVPRDVNAVVATLNSIEARLEEQENPGPVLIHCGDGVSTSGLIAVILNEILRMKLQNGTINIVESVKTIKAVEKNVVTSVDQLQFCYDVVWAYLHPNVQEDVYMNV